MDFGKMILGALLPIFVIMLLGYITGKRKVFTADNARSFNKFVLNFALPAALFLSIVKADRELIFEDLKLTIISIVVIVACFMWAFVSCKWFFKHSKKEAAVCALIAGSPTIGFLGFAVLEPIYGFTTSTGLVIAIVAIVVNAITIPIGLYLLDPDDTPTPTTTPAVGADGKPVAVAAAPKKKGNNAFVNALKQPVVWAPILAVIFILIGIKFPAGLDPTFNLIAKANAGMAVFAAGITLSAQVVRFSWEIGYNTIIKLILMPLVLLVVGILFKMNPENLQMLVMAGALPPAFSGIIIGSRYNIYVNVGTSSLAVSTILFMGAAPFWYWFAKFAADMFLK